MRKPLSNNKGLTLIELLISACVLAIVLTGLLSLLIACIEMNETAKNSNLAINAVQQELENLRRAPFSSLNDTYAFTMPGSMANSSLGRATIDKTNSSYYRVDVGMCWRQRGSRIIGECEYVNGTLSFSDGNSNGILDSPAHITTYMSQR